MRSNDSAGLRPRNGGSAADPPAAASSPPPLLWADFRVHRTDHPLCRDRLLRCEESLEQSDVQDLAEIDPAVIRFRDDPRWAELYEATKAVLNTREHVPTGTERKLRRKEEAAAARARDRKPRPKRGSR